jgi:hypothetical protein
VPLLNASPLALPEQADLSTAWQETFDPPPPLPGADVRRVIPGETYEQLLAAKVNFNTSAVVGNRLVLVQVFDPNGNIVWTATAPNAQPAASTKVYTFSAYATQAYESLGIFVTVPIPSILLLPTFIIQIGAFGQDAADFFQVPTLTLLRIPTAPVRKPEEPLFATPLGV